MSETPDSGPDRTVASGRPRGPAWWRILGVRRHERKWLPIGLTLWGWFLVLAVAVVAGGIGFGEYSMQPEFCRSCHIMEPYYQAWHKSTHKNVPCADCHFEPGWRSTLRGKYQASSQVVKYLTRTYGTKPHAEIRDASCLRSGCHEKRLIEGKVRWHLTATDGEPIDVAFDHTPHIRELRRGKQLKCVSCHSQIVQGEHLTVTLDTCFICHFKGLKHGRDNEVLAGCRSCHDAPRQLIKTELGLFNHQEYVGRGVACENCHSDSIRGDGQVPKQVCGTCHNKAEHLGRFGDTVFLHKNHVTDHKVECTNCHIQIEHTLNAAGPGSVGSCGTCHEGSHAGPRALYWGIGGRGVPDMPSPMARTQVDCIACHRHKQLPATVAEVVGQTFTAVGESCVYCHGTKYDGTLAEWKQTIAAMRKESDATYERVSGIVSKARLSAPAMRRAKVLLADADHNRRLVKLGHGVHNVNYTTALLNAANEFCQKAEEIVRQAGAKVSRADGTD